MKTLSIGPAGSKNWNWKKYVFWLNNKSKFDQSHRKILIAYKIFWIDYTYISLTEIEMGHSFISKPICSQFDRYNIVWPFDPNWIKINYGILHIAGDGGLTDFVLPFSLRNKDFCMHVSIFILVNIRCPSIDIRFW